ncbi:hypothetical protein HEM55_024760 [Escherichia coli]|nr:hypothetical protein [Escherichia coli]
MITFNSRVIAVNPPCHHFAVHHELEQYRFFRCCVNTTMFDRLGDADDFLDCFIILARIVGGTF